MTMYYVMLEVVPNADNEEKDECEGAFLNCWVKTDSEEEAVELAKEYAEQEGWEVLGVEECRAVKREDYIGSEEEEENLEILDEAAENGLAGIFYTW